MDDSQPPGSPEPLSIGLPRPLARGALVNNRYQVDVVLGQGGFGITYRAWDPHLTRWVALKELFPMGAVRTSHGASISTGDQSEFIKLRTAFLDEGRRLAALRHPGIVVVHEQFEEAGTAYLIMELLEGQSLAALAGGENARMTAAFIESVVRQVGSALEAVHRAGLLHRDVKPANIMLTNDNRCVLVDFGAARSFANEFTRDHTALISQGYSPLEQYGEAEGGVGPASDIYALSATAYALLTGQRPVAAPMRVARPHVAPPSELVSGVSPGLDRCLLAGLKVLADERPQSMAEFFALLDGTAEAGSGSALSSGLAGSPGSVTTLVTGVGSGAGAPPGASGSLGLSSSASHGSVVGVASGSKKGLFVAVGTAVAVAAAGVGGYLVLSKDDSKTPAVTTVVSTIAGATTVPGIGGSSIPDDRGTIDTYVGLGAGDGPGALRPIFRYPNDVTLDAAGNLYISDGPSHRVRRVAPDGTVTIVAGSGSAGSGGDGATALNALLNRPGGIAVDSVGNVFIADQLNDRVRRVDPDGTISTVVGNGSRGFSGDGGKAVDAQLDFPRDVVVDESGNLYVADTANGRVRKVAPDGTITTVLGSGGDGFSGLDGPARSASLAPVALALSPDGSILYVADLDHDRVVRIKTAAANPIMVLVAGSGDANGTTDDGTPAVKASVSRPSGLATSASGELYISEFGRDRLLRVDSAGKIAKISGQGRSGFGGDRGPATLATLHDPRGLVVAPDGTVLLADAANGRIRRIDDAGVITTVAGATFPDKARATEISLGDPVALAIDGRGRLIVADTLGAVVYRVDGSGQAEKIAGNGLDLVDGDDQAIATETPIGQPRGVAVGPDGSIYIADGLGRKIRKLRPDGRLITLAGTGEDGTGGDGGPAEKATLSEPYAVAVDPGGNVYVADRSANTIRKIAPDGTITKVAGTGTFGYSGDEGQASAAELASPASLAISPDGALYVGDLGNDRVRKIDAAGVITTVAGGGEKDADSDGGKATDAKLEVIEDVALDPEGRLVIADWFGDRVRRVAADGTITTVAGTGVTGFSGDKGLALDAKLSSPTAIAIGPRGTIYIGGGSRVRAVNP